MSKVGNSQDNIFSVRRNVGYAVFITLLLLLFQAIGLREYASAISGILPGVKESILGLLYVITYFAFIGIVPILLIAGVILYVCGILYGRKR